MNYIENGKLMDGFADFIGNRYWEGWSTLVFNEEFAHEMTPDRAIGFVSTGFIDKINKDKRQVGKPLSWFGVVEEYKLGGLHAHLLLSGFCKDRLGSWEYSDLGRLWRRSNAIKYHGFASGIYRLDIPEQDQEPGGYFYINSYDYSKGAGAYCAKYITKNICAWDFELHKDHCWNRVLDRVMHDFIMEKEKKERILREYDVYQKKLLDKKKFESS